MLTPIKKLGVTLGGIMKYDYIVCSKHTNKYTICRTEDYVYFEYWNLKDVWAEDYGEVFENEHAVCLQLCDLLLKDKNASN